MAAYQAVQAFMALTQMLVLPLFFCPARYIR